MSEDALRQWAASLNTWHLPRWQELPQIELYMDQVVAFLEAQLGSLMLAEEKFITAAMVNNYVKQGLLPTPNKKKYGRQHVARLIVITLGKQTVSLADIKTAFDFVLCNQEAPEAYDAFCERQEAALAAFGAALLSGEEESDLLLMRLSATAISASLAANRLLSLWGAETRNLKV